MRRISLSILICVATVLALGLYTPKYAVAGYCSSCRACTVAAIQAASIASQTAFQALHGAIRSLGVVFYQGSTDLSSAFQASSSNITTEVNISARSEKQLLDAFNTKNEIREQQVYALEQNRNIDENYQDSGISQNMSLAYATQENMSISEYSGFIQNHNEVYDKAVKSKIDTTIASYIAGSDKRNMEPLLWGGDIIGAEQAVGVILLTKQILFKGEKDPYKSLIPSDQNIPSLNRDDAALASAQAIWENRMQPAVDAFAFDQALRTWTDEQTPSIAAWLDGNVTNFFVDIDATIDFYAEGTRADLIRGLVIERKKLNLIKYLKLKSSHIDERLTSSSLAINESDELQLLRNLSVSGYSQPIEESSDE
jgi:hypothetical protein